MRSSHPVVFLWKDVLKICSKFTGEHSCRSVISIKLLCNFTEITLWHGFSPVNLLHIFRTRFWMAASGVCTSEAILRSVFSKYYFFLFITIHYTYISIETTNQFQKYVFWFLKMFFFDNKWINEKVNSYR